MLFPSDESRARLWASYEPSDAAITRARAWAVFFGAALADTGEPRHVEIGRDILRALLETGGYDVSVYDILGDVVCGGFATPLRAGFGNKVFIVCSEELMSIYAANNIAKAVRHYSPNGIRLAGLIANLRDAEVDRRPLERFAKLINTKIIQYLPRDPAVREAEFKRQTVVEHAPKAAVTRALARLANTAMRIKHNKLPLPTPLEDRDFYALSYTQFKKCAPRRKK